MKAPKFITARAVGVPTMPEPFRQLTVLEPALLRLWADCLCYRRNWECYPDWNCWSRLAAWYGYPDSPFIGIKPQLLGLVGRCRPDRDDILRSRHAYDCAYKALLDALGA